MEGRRTEEKMDRLLRCLGGRFYPQMSSHLVCYLQQTIVYRRTPRHSVIHFNMYNSHVIWRLPEKFTLSVTGCNPIHLLW